MKKKADHLDIFAGLLTQLPFYINHLNRQLSFHPKSNWVHLNLIFYLGLWRIVAAHHLSKSKRFLDHQHFCQRPLFSFLHFEDLVLIYQRSKGLKSCRCL
jgi:hypothetical protein